MNKGLQATEALWPPIQHAYAWVHQAAHILNNHQELSGQEVHTQYEALLLTIQQQKSLGSLQKAIEQFLKVTRSYAPNLFHCYDIADLPRTNNELEHCFGSAHYYERRTSGCRGAIPGLVVRGAVRVITALASRQQCFTVQALRLRDQTAWRTLRQQLEYRQESRPRQGRFRKDPLASLSALEDVLLQT